MSSATQKHAAGHGSLSSYLVGFVLSVILTGLAFWLVMANPTGNSPITIISIMVLAVAQIAVHVFCFLHVDGKSEGGWTMMALIFTIVMVVIVLTGSLWVMYNLNTNMMPMTAHDAGQIP